jgi:hypothetical protein
MKKNDILLILIPSFVFALAWISFSIYHNIITSTISEPLSVQIAPITPSFNTSVINDLKNREKVSPLYNLSALVQEPTIQASPSANPIVITNSTPVDTPADTGQATPGGSLTQ